ncbi:hypothetical protein BDW22DRAFT_1319603 [Trametopsis cervina]|nr:hypothetical protein BDW22DRAFT_1319603 [Trametopsis cervina]
MDKTPVSIANLGFATTSRILRSSWCPDKDLLVIVMRVADRDRLSLWKMNGSKKWEVDVRRESGSTQEIVDIAWSPDGQYIAVANNPPLITLHSLQNGQQERTLSIPPLPSGGTHNLASIWWFQEHREEKKANIPDIFKRGGDIPGSAHAILKTQPLLDALHDEAQPLSATDLFAFQGSSGNKNAAQQTIPDVISSWPTLPPDPLAASIQTQAPSSKESRPGEELDEVDDPNINSILVASDDAGEIYIFLDGSYALGVIELDAPCSVVSMRKRQNTALFLHPQVHTAVDISHTASRPAILHTPFLGRRFLRDMARASSSCRELMWYALRVVKEMRSAWYGSDTTTGARDLGSSWIKALEKKQTEQFGVQEPSALLDLTLLLATGKPSEAVSDLFGSGEQMSERGLQKWESNVTEALMKLRDYSSRRMVPACQRLLILLQEVYGWSLLPQYSTSGLNSADIKECMELAKAAVYSAETLAFAARTELRRFKEFMTWLRYETHRLAAQHPDAAVLPQKHDVLDVDEYLNTGLVNSVIDLWFTGDFPRLTTASIRRPVLTDLKMAMEKAKEAVKKDIEYPPVRYLDKNIDLLMQELSTRCRRIFLTTANATSRTAVISNSFGKISDFPRESGVRNSANSPIFVKERTVDDTSEVRLLSFSPETPAYVVQGSTFLQYLAIQTPRADQSSYLCLLRMTHPERVDEHPQSISVATLHSSFAPRDGREETIPIDILDAEFFDEQILIIVYRPLDQEHGATSIATIGYADLEFEDIPAGYVGSLTREGLMLEMLERVRDGQIAAVPIPIIGCRELAGCQEGSATLAVNGRAGRRVVCVLDSSGLALEVLDMEGEEEDEEDEMETAAG